MCARLRDPCVGLIIGHMKTELLTLANFDVASASKYLNLGLAILLVVVLAILVLSFLRGLLRGWKYGTYRLLAFAIMIVVVLATLSPQASWVGQWNLSSLKLQAIQFNLTINDDVHTIVAEWTTVQGTLEDVLTQVMMAYGANGSSSGVLAYASVLATSIIKLLLICAWGVILSTLGALLVMLLWHIAFKRFTPKERRKVKKARFVSAFEELLVASACLGMLLSPWTGIANALSGNFKVDEDKAKENETVSMITEMLGVYRESAFAKTFFSWNSMDGSNTFDRQLLSFLTQSNVDELKTDIYSEISDIASFSSKAINAGLLSAYSSEGLRWYFLLTCSSLPELLTDLSRSELIKAVLPFAVTIATNMDQVKEFLGEETCKYLTSDSVDWSEEIKNLGKIYQNLLDSDIFDCVVDEASPTPKFDFTQLKYVFTGKDASGNERDVSEAMHAVADSISDSALYGRLISGVVAQLVKKETPSSTSSFALSDFLPKVSGEVSYDELVKVDYGRELTLVYDFVYNVNKISPDLIDGIFDLLDGKERSDDEWVSAYRNLGALAAEKSSEFVPLLVGERDDEGNPIKDSPDCLLDSSLIQNALPKSLDVLESSASKSLNLEDFSLSSSKETLQNVDDYKKEFGAILDVASDFASSDEGVAFLKDGSGLTFDENGKIIRVEPALISALKNSLEGVDSSIVLTEALPQVAEHYMKDFASILSEYGIENLDFHCEGLGREIGNLLDLLTYSGNLLLALSNLGTASPMTAAELLAGEEESLLRLLDAFSSSKILNPEGEGNANYVSLINHIFANAGIDDLEMSADALNGVKLESDRLADGSYPRGSDGRILADGENSKVVRFIFDVLDSVPLQTLFSLSDASVYQAAKMLSKLDVTSLFSDIGGSAVLSSVSGNLLDHYFAPVIGYDSSIDTSSSTLSEDIGFANVSDWAKEGAIIQKMLNLASNGLDVGNLDLNSISPELLVSLFSSLAESQIFEKKDETGAIKYMFPAYFCSKLLLMADENTLPYFLDEGKIVSYSASFETKKQSASLFVESTLALSSAEDWVGDDGEIAVFGEIIKDLQALGGASNFSAISSKNLPVLEQTLYDLSSSSTIGQVMIANALSKALPSLGEIGGIDFSLANVSLLYQNRFATKEARKSEVDALCLVLDAAYDANYGLIDENGNFVESSLDIDSLSVDFLLRPLLDGLSSSEVLSTPKESGGESLLSSCVSSLLVKSGLYGSEEGFTKDSEFSPEHAKGMTVSSIVSSVTDWDKEIEGVCALVSSLQTSGLLDGASLDLASLSGDSSLVYDALSSLNDSELFYRALPLQIEKALNSLSISSSAIKYDLSLADPFVMENSFSSDYSPYEESEICNLASILSSSSSLSNLDASSLSSSLGEDSLAILSPLYASRVFNSKTAGAGSKEGFTCAQAILIDALSGEGVGDMIYSSASPKDQALGLKDAPSKASYLISHYLGKGSDGDYSHYSASMQSQEGNAFYEVLGQGECALQRALSELSSSNLTSLLEGSSIDFSSVDSSSLSKLLKTVSHCSLFRDICINELSSSLGSDSYKVEGIDLSLANVYYPYYFKEDGSPRSEVDFDAGYGDDEIDLLVTLLDAISKDKASFETDRISDIDAYSLRSIFFEMSDSLLFNLTGPNLYSSSYSAGWDNGVYTPASEGAFVSSDLTVFEQAIYLVYDKTGLGKSSFSCSRDFSLLVAYNGDEDLASKIKLHNAISSFSSSWRDEISCFTTDDFHDSGLIALAQKFGLTTEDESKIASSPDLMKKMTPDNLTTLFSSLGRSKLCPDALPLTLQRLFELGSSSSGGLGATTFSTYRQSLGSSTSFSSSPSFLQAKKAYSSVTFASSSYSGSETLTVMGDLDGDSDYETDLASYCPLSYETGTWIVDTSKLGCLFKVSISEAGQVSYAFDTASFFLEEGEYEQGGDTLEALHTFLTSIYASDGSKYYVFSTDESAQEVLEDGVELYGITALLFDSKIYSSSSYDASFTPSDNGVFTARAHCLYKLLTWTQNVSGVSVQVNALDAVDAPSLNEKYGSSIPLYSRLSSIDALLEGGVDSFAEAAFFELAIPGASLSQSVHKALSSLSLNSASYRFLSSFLYGHAASGEAKGNGDYYDDLLSSSSFSYYFSFSKNGTEEIHSSASSKSVFGPSLLAEAYNFRVQERLAYVGLSSHEAAGYSLSSPTKEESSYPRSSYIPASSMSSLSNFDAYGYDSSSSSYSYPYFGSLLSSVEKGLVHGEELLSKGISFSSTGITLSPTSFALTASEKDELNSIGGELDSDSLIDVAKDYAKLAYLADWYDYFVLKGNAVSSIGEDAFFHGENAPFSLLATDFYSPYEAGYLKGASSSFSFVKAVNTVMVETA